MGKSISEVMDLITNKNFKNIRGLDIYGGLIDSFDMLSSDILDMLCAEDEIKKLLAKMTPEERQKIYDIIKISIMDKKLTELEDSIFDNLNKNNYIKPVMFGMIDPYSTLTGLEDRINDYKKEKLGLNEELSLKEQFKKLLSKMTPEERQEIYDRISKKM